MHDRYLDLEELRPTGEASHIPDTRLDDGCEGDPRRQRVATSSGGYPDAPTAADGECRSCGASVPDGQTKCRFCLTNHLDVTPLARTRQRRRGIPISEERAPGFSQSMNSTIGATTMGYAIPGYSALQFI